jgi:exopolysaccharide biosynthesis polyprenyl glycosylphosphotransferase
MAILNTASLVYTPPLSSASVSRGRRPGTRRPIPWHSFQLLAEMTLALLALAGVLILFDPEQTPHGIEGFLSLRITLKNVLRLTVFAVGWATVFSAFRLYDLDAVARPRDERLRLCAAVTLGVALAALIALPGARGGLNASQLLWLWIVCAGATLILRDLRRWVTQPSRDLTHRRVLIVGRGPRAQRMWSELVRDPVTHYELAGFIDTATSQPATPDIATRTVGTLDNLEAILMRQMVDDVCLALPVKSFYPQIQEALLVCERIGIRTHYAVDLFEARVAWPRYDESGQPRVTMHVVPDDYRLLIKRLCDAVMAAVALVLLAPLLLLIALAVKVTSPGPALFAQERYGLNRHRFRMLKFRTMVMDAEQRQADLEQVNEADGPVFKMTSDPRVTRIGRLLRRTSLDELPQLINVLRGHMSLVGPRPLPLRDVERFTRASDLRRFSVRPGLTCLWQISGRSNVGFDEWMRLDLIYIDGWSLWLDLRILVATFPVVLRGTGAR